MISALIDQKCGAFRDDFFYEFLFCFWGFLFLMLQRMK